MKRVLMIAAAALLAGCAAPQQPDYWTATRIGHAGAPAVAADTAGGPDYRTAALAEAGQFVSAMRPGLHKTRTGAPWLVFHSASYRSGGVPLSGRAAAQSAMSYASSKWKTPYAAQTHAGGAKTRFRIVTADGNSFAVLNRIRMPLKYLAVSDKDALKQLYGHVARLSGCTVTGPALTQRVNGTVEKLAAPVACS